jgi:hypothetical protein
MTWRVMGRAVAVAVAGAAALATSGCLYGSGRGGDRSVSGMVTGVPAQGLLVSDIGGSAVFVSSDGRFVLESAFMEGDAYDIQAQPTPTSALRCQVERGAGSITAADITDVAVTCRPTTFTVGGSAIGVGGVGLVLESRGERIALAKDGSFMFFAPLTVGSTYAVTIVQAPEGQTCTVENASGTGAGAVRDVIVRCANVES